MEKISIFLNKLKKFSRPDILTREKTAEIIEEETGFKITEKDVFIRNRTIFLKIHNSVLKNEIYLKKEKILKKIQDLSGNKNVLDIK